MSHPVKSILSELPAKPGIYFFKNARGETIYIGKARSLADRVKSYFQTSDDPKVRNILAETTRLDYLLTGTEREAAFLENNFIQQTQPKFNLRLKDDKSFPYLRINIQDPVPGIYFSRKISTAGDRFFGPFSPAREARKTIQILTKSFRLRTCEEAAYRGRKRPCLEYDLGQCSGPCVGLISSRDYQVSVRNALLFLEGRTDELTALLREAMAAAAAAERFEEAARTRDLLRTIDQIRIRPKTISVRRENWDIFGSAQAGPAWAIHVFHMRDGKVCESREFAFETDLELPPPKVIGNFIESFYRDHPRPHKILLPFAPAVSRPSDDLPLPPSGPPFPIIVPRRGRGRTLTELASKNAEILLRRSQTGQASLEELKSILGLSALPVRMDGFDVSHTQGLETVASLVTFLNGRPWKDGYRRYRIKTVRGVNDVAALSEVVGRRFSRLLREQKPLPDLVLVDGGKPQFEAARAVLESYERAALPLLALAKREEIIYTADRPDGVRLDRTSAALKLLQHIRDEAHRFAVAYHRARRSKRSFD
jgi:excinuclease ABC subunit C